MPAAIVFRKYFAQKYPDYADFRKLPKNPVAQALVGEDMIDHSWQRIENRPVLSTALLFAYDALAQDPSRDEKLNYVLALTQEMDEYGWRSSGWGSDYTINFPTPVSEYADLDFPLHLTTR